MWGLIRIAEHDGCAKETEVGFGGVNTVDLLGYEAGEIEAGTAEKKTRKKTRTDGSDPKASASVWDAHSRGLSIAH